MKILITAGATWIKIDEVRVITNKFTGRTGFVLAKELNSKGNSVTLIVNDHCIQNIKVKGVKIITYRYYDEFKKAVLSELTKARYDAVVHSAAVSDYKIKGQKSGKIPSFKKKLTLCLVPTEKIVKLIREKAPEILLVQFKLEVKRNDLLSKAYKSLKENNSDFVVANCLQDLKTGYKAAIVSRGKETIPVVSLKDLCRKLHSIISLLGRGK